ncbi:MAG: orotidine-5'-phosphate decarboxylase [Candidatus Moraniibacteriota bacterium]|nr:MAG: orotidine-5'-phosphate decarboxylase [Candidatus Moranbacteria bacterium]
MSDKRCFKELLQAGWDAGKFVCVGLDSELEKIPAMVYLPRGDGNVRDVAQTMTIFNQIIVEATKDLVLAYKPNLAFYIAHGDLGLWALRDTVLHIHTVAPDVPVILDAKDMDIGNTNAGYVQMAFEYCEADAITVNPYLGMEAAQPFLDQKDKGVIVLCRTSNKGSGEFQGLDVSGDSVPGGYMLLYQYVAHRVSRYWNTNGNCALVVGATYPGELAEVRQIVGDVMPILIPGIGAQGGDLEATVKAGRDSRGQGMIINASRSIIFASSGPEFAEAARRETQKLNGLINQYRNA